MTQLQATTVAANSFPGDAVIVTHYANAPLTGAAAEVNTACEGRLQRLLESKDLTGKKFECVLLPVLPGVAARTVAVLGLGPQESCDVGVAYRAAGTVAKALSGKPLSQVAFYPPAEWSPAQQTAAMAGAMNGCVGQDLHKSQKSRFPWANLAWHGASSALLEEGRILGDSILLARRLVNEPADVMYPAAFAEQAQRVAQANGFSCEVWDEQRLTQERCGALLAVGRAAAQPPRLVIMRYQGAPTSQPTLALVGKGVTFDSGGLSLKPTDGMKTMKCDMAGAATVLATMQAIAQAKLPINVIGLCGLVENMISGSSYKLGDVLHARNGKTIEVLNTDAEGRLVLADVLDVAVQLSPSKIIDLATLTGACLVALGTDVVGVMSNHDAWQSTVLAASQATGEPSWPLPMFPEYSEHIKSDIADIKNTGDGRWAGAIAGAKFLEEFVAGKPWVHLDIAGPAFLEGSKPWQDGGGTGIYVRTLFEIARNWK